MECGGSGQLQFHLHLGSRYINRGIYHKIEAVYEHGVLRPLRQLSLAESQGVKLIITDAPQERSQLDTELIERARAEVSAIGSIPIIEQVRAALASIPGSLSQDIIEERREY